jgi:hypothetical protein
MARGTSPVHGAPDRRRCVRFELAAGRSKIAEWCPLLAYGGDGATWTRGSIRLWDRYSTTSPRSSRDGEARVSAIDNGVGTHREGAERLDTGWCGVQVGPGGGQLIQPGEVL